ncbi:MAG: hypothetical protein ACOYY2_05975 [Actinomycetota bacterium]
MTPTTLSTEIRKNIRDRRPLYAVAGAGDLAVAKLREVPERLAGLRREVTGRRLELDRTALAQRVSAWQTEALALPERAQAFALDRLGRAGTTYDELADRGRHVLGRLRGQQATEEARRQARTTVRRAKGAVSSARKTATAAGQAVEAGADKVGS